MIHGSSSQNQLNYPLESYFFKFRIPKKYIYAIDLITMEIIINYSSSRVPPPPPYHYSICIIHDGVPPTLGAGVPPNFIICLIQEGVPPILAAGVSPYYYSMSHAGGGISHPRSKSAPLLLQYMSHKGGSTSLLINYSSIFTYTVISSSWNETLVCSIP